MDSSPLVLIDVSNLAYRCHYTTGKLKNGVLFGFFKYILSLEQKLQSTKMVFCFDTKPYKRSEIYADYKKKGNPKSEEEMEDLYECFRQINLLKKQLLEDLGYINVFWSAGYEADDIIASVKSNCRYDETDLVAVSTDKDLYQLLGCTDEKLFKLLGHRFDIWNPAKNERYTSTDFIDEWKSVPEQWALIKAIAGCSTDNIKGIKGVKEKTAIKYLNKELKESSQAFQRISVGPELIEINLKLTKLPFPGTPSFEIKKDNVTAKKWKEVMINLGLKSLIDTCPVASRRF